MKILMINDLYERTGGSEAYLLNLFEALEERGHTVIVIYGSETRLDNRTKNRPGYLVDFNQPIRVIVNAIADIIKKESPDIIHIHNLGLLENKNIYSYMAKLYDSLPVVKSVHIHASYCPSGLKYFYNGPHICHRRYGSYCLFSMFLNKCFNGKRPWVTLDNYNRPKQFLDNCHLFKKIIVYSEFIKGSFINNGLKKESIEVLPYFTDMPELKNIDDKNIILFAGRVYKEKGLNYLIRALKFIKVPFELIAIGDGRELDNCKNISQKLGLEDKVKFIGWKFNLQDYYRQASIVVVPSIWPEPFGIVGIEAMSYAKPVVAFNVGGIPEWLEDGYTGFLIEPYNIKEMASKLELLLKDKGLAIRLGQQGRQVVEVKFNKDRHTDRLLEIYVELKKAAKV